MAKRKIGRSEIVDLPGLGIAGIRAKTDTGAYTSAIHYHHAKVIEKAGQNILQFCVLDPSHPEYNEKVFSFKKYRTKRIKNSFGEVEERYIIETKIRLFGEDYITQFSLSNRGKQKFPILLGRKLLNKNFVVDTSKKNLSIKYLKK